MTKVDDVGEVDGWRCWLCDEAVDPTMSVEDDRGPSIDTCHPTEKGPRRVAGPERLAHRGCNTRKGQVSPEVPWPDDLFAVDPAPLLVVLDRLARKGGREVVARCPTPDDGEALAGWLTDRVSRLVPDLPVEASVASGGSQYVVALTVPRR
jgi:hypothetical protein